MKFDAKTVLHELKALKDKPTSELLFDWSIINAWSNKLETSKNVPDFIKKKFSSVENFQKYVTTLYTELKRRNINVKLQGAVKNYITVNENSITVIDLYTAAKEVSEIPCKLELNSNTETNVDTDNITETEIEISENSENTETSKTNETSETNQLFEQLPNYMLKRGFIRLVGSTVSKISGKFTDSKHVRSDEESDIDIYVDMPNNEVPTWIHKKLHLMLSKLFDKPVQLIYQDPNVNGPTEDSIVLYDLALVKRIEHEPTYTEEQIELSHSTVTFKDLKIPKAFKTIYGLEHASVKDIPFDSYVIQPKYNGMKVIIFNGGKDVYSESGNKLQLDLSRVFIDRTPNNYVFAGEIWSDTLPRQTVVGKVKKGELDKELTVTIYDVLNPDEDYRTQLQLIRKYVKQKNRIKNFNTLNEAIQFVERHPEYDGFVIKDLDTTCRDKKFSIKVKKEADIDVQVLKRLQNKNGTYKYEVGYLNNNNNSNGNEIISLGETFSTKLKFEPDNVIEVSCSEINDYGNSVKGYAIRVKGLSNNSKPYTKREILKIAKEGGLLNIIQEVGTNVQRNSTNQDK